MYRKAGTGIRLPVPSQVIAFTVSGLRQKYLREVLGTWGRARGVGDWHLLFALEPCHRTFPVAEFTQWAGRSFASAEVRIADEHHGCLRNTRRAMRLAFASGAEFAICAEEDCKVSEDVLEYFTWARGAYAADEKVTAVCAHSLRTEAGGEADAVLGDWFNPIVWGTWQDRWKGFIDPGWGPHQGNEESWDNNLRVQIREAGRRSVFPVRSRSQHIGEVSTQHRYDLAAYFYRGALSSSFAGHREPCDYREIPFTEDLGLLV
jgi:hypothetical protein